MMERIEKTKVRDWHVETYPHDDLGCSISADITFEDVFNTLDRRKSVYALLGVADSLIRENVFTELAAIMGVNYDYIYDQWMLCNENEELNVQSH